MNAELRVSMEQYGLPIASSPSEVGLSAERLARIKLAITPFIEAKETSGILTLIARHGKIAHMEATGYADLNEKKPLHLNTIFRVYSMAKPLTVVAVMVLYEEGKFFLDDPVSHYLPEFTDMKVYQEGNLVEARQPITIRHLLTHTAGLTYSMIPDEPTVAEMYKTAGLNEAISRLDGDNLESYVSNLSQLPLISQPGEAWRYSEGMCVLARLVEVITGKTYREFLLKNVCKPLNMVDTDYFVPEEKLDRLAKLYEQTANQELKETNDYGGDYSIPPTLEAGGSGIVSTAADYLRFAQMLLNQGELDEIRLLSPSSTRLIMSNHFGKGFCDLLPNSFLSNFKGMGFGFGGYVVTDAIARGEAGSEGEYGWGGWANTRFWIDPKSQLIGMVLTQLIPLPGAILKTGDRMHQMTYQAVVK